MTTHRFGKPLATLRRAKLDNLALVPGSMLPYKRQWQAIANQLPDNSVLIVLPDRNKPQRRMLDRVVSLLRGKGHRVTTSPAAEVR